MKPAIKAVLFDFDGTLTQPGSLDFNAIRAAVGGPAGLPILEYIETLREQPDAYRNAYSILDRFELEAAAKSFPNTDAENLVLFLAGLGLRLGILTRNSRRALERAFLNFKRISPEDFEPVLTREDVVRQKPHPEGVHLSAERMGISPREMLVVGDYLFDIQAGQDAGAQTAFLDNGNASQYPCPKPDYLLRRLGELKSVFNAPVSGKACMNESV